MKKSAFRSNKKFFHLTLNCHVGRNREYHWRELQKILKPLLSICDTEVHALVMMDTHVHLLTSNFTNTENFLSASLQDLLLPNIPHDNLSEPILNFTQYLNTYRYIYRNPLEAGLVAKAELYPYSSLPAVLGKAQLRFMVSDHLGLIQNPIHLLRWLNGSGDYKASRIQWQKEKSA